METTLLATKLLFHKPRAGLVARPRILERLNEALDASFVLVLKFDVSDILGKLGCSEEGSRRGDGVLYCSQKQTGA